MTSPITEAVVAGSRGFALALLAPLTERIGTRPRIAADPSQALAFCTAPGGLVVVEFLGADTLRAIKDLVLQGNQLRIVAALPETHAAAEGPLRALGVDLARWDGTPEAVLGAVTRQLAAPPPSPAAPRTAPPAKPGTASASAAAPAVRVKAAVPSRPPAASPPAKAARAPLAPVPADAASPRAPASPQAARATPPAAGAWTPAPPLLSRPPVIAVAPPAASAARGVAAAPVSAAPAVAAAPRSATPDTSPAAAQPGSIAAPHPPSSGGRGGIDLFADLLQGDVDVDLAPAPKPPPPAAAKATAAPGGWPATAPGEADAAAALARALSGEAEAAGSSLVVAADVAASLSDLECAVLKGEPQGFDAEPIRGAAVMRVRVAAALATVPAPGGEVDAQAVSAFLAEIDALLGKVNALTAAAPPEAQASLEAVRNALVREAIDFSEAAQQAVPESAPQPVASGRPIAARLVSIDSAATEAPPRRGKALWIVLALSVAVAAGFHGWRWYQRSAAIEARRAAGVPASMVELGGPGKVRIFVQDRDEPPNPADVARVKATAEAQGNTVKEVNGMILVVPGKKKAAQPAANP
jgi:hypothetical protein